MTPQSSDPWRSLLALFRPYPGRTAVTGVLLVIAGLLPLIGPVLIAQLLDGAIAGTSSRVLFALGGVYLFVAAVQQAITVFSLRHAADLAWLATNDLRAALTTHVLNLDLAFHRQTSPGELVSRVDGDITAVSEFFTAFAARATIALSTLVGMLAIVTVIYWPVGLGLTVYLAISFGLVFGLRQHAADESGSEHEASGRLLGEVEERLAGADDLRANGAGSYAVARLQAASARWLQAMYRRERKAVELWITSTAVFNFGAIAILALASVLLASGRITIGVALLLYQYTQLMRQPLQRLADETERVQRAVGGMVRTIQLLGERSTITDSGQTALPPGPVAVEFRQVSFAYSDESQPTPVLDSLSFTVEPGTRLGILGRTGSGKTTISRLLLRLIEPTAGGIYLNGVGMNEVPLAELRARTGVVTQDVHLFEGSLLNNIRLFDRSVTEEAVEEALEQLGLTPWIDSLEAGIHSPLGAGGRGLSAGQGQLVALARLFLRQPDLVVLDEASSRIDPQTERHLTTAIDNLLADRTAVVIAHRLATVQRLDSVMVLDGGQVVEHGPTQALAADASSHYARLLALDTTVAEEQLA